MAYLIKFLDAELNIACLTVLKFSSNSQHPHVRLLLVLSLGCHLFTLPLFCAVILLQLAVSGVKNGLVRK